MQVSQVAWKYAKICIPKKSNKAHKLAYEKLCSRVQNVKPMSEIRKNRPEGYPPCTKKILQVLELENEITKKELKEKIGENQSLGKIGYKIHTISRALRRLKAVGKIKISDDTKNIMKVN